MCRHDAAKQNALAVQGDAQRTLRELGVALGAAGAATPWIQQARKLTAAWNAERDAAVAQRNGKLPSDAEVLGAVNAVIGPMGTVVCAAGGLPGELHKLWRAQDPQAYHVEYGYSCMGYEIAGGLGVKMALPQRDVTVLVGDGSYLMMNSEIATSIALGQKLLIVLLDNRGYGCINRLQQACGGNLLQQPAGRLRLPRSTSSRTPDRWVHRQKKWRRWMRLAPRSPRRAAWLAPR